LSVLDYFRKKKDPAIVAAKEESEDDQGQIFSLEETVHTLSEEEISQKQNKSRLLPHHQRLMNGQVHHPEPIFWTHHTVLYKKKTFGKYGEASGINPGLLWPTRKELKRQKEYEDVCNPFTFQEMVHNRRELRAAEEKAYADREREVDEKMKLLDKFKTELLNKQKAKEQEQKDAKDRREKLMEEVRRHFGFTVDSRDERFQELLAKKEKEQRKAMKEARKMEKQQKVLDKMESSTSSSSKSKPAKEKSKADDDDD